MLNPDNHLIINSQAWKFIAFGFLMACLMFGSILLGYIINKEILTHPECPEGKIGVIYDFETGTDFTSCVGDID